MLRPLARLLAQILLDLATFALALSLACLFASAWILSRFTGLGPQSIKGAVIMGLARDVLAAGLTTKRGPSNVTPDT